MQVVLSSLLVFSRYSTVGTHVTSEDVIIDDPGPGVVTVKWIVEFGCDATHHGKLESGDARKVMVFVVISDVEGDQVQHSVVGVSFLALLEDVMLGDEMPSDGVDSHAQQSSANVEHQRLRTKEMGQAGIEHDGDDSVDRFHRRHRLWVDE